MTTFNNPGVGSVSTPNTANIVGGSPLPSGDQLVISQDGSPFREGSFSLLSSGQLFALVGDLTMKYWSHNTGLDVNGNFLPRDDTGPCAIMVFSEGTGSNAPSYIMYSCPTGVQGTVPGTFTQAGNPTKWIPINDNGTTRYLPAW
jgi:hypothetical protein